MAENSCTLVAIDPKYCKNICFDCGWNAEVLKERNAALEANGLTLCSDGLRRLIIRKGGETDGNT